MPCTSPEPAPTDTASAQPSAPTVSGAHLQRDLEAIAEGLTSKPRWLPSRLFYDDRGSQLFDEITRLPEYYPTRAEAALLDARAAEIAHDVPAEVVIELGAGTATKTRTLLSALRDVGSLRRYVPVDVSRAELDRVEEALAVEYPGLEVEPVVTDFMAGELCALAVPDALVLFLGSTIGNFERDQAVDLLRRIASAMTPGASFLLGVDLVKPVAALEAAYNDAAGVTAEFNRNILRVVNRRAGGDFDPDGFEHRAVYDTPRDRIEMRLVSRREQRVRLEALDLDLTFAPGELIRTEISTKYRRSGVERMLGEAGFRPTGWLEEPGVFALARAVAGPSRE